MKSNTLIIVAIIIIVYVWYKNKNKKASDANINAYSSIIPSIGGSSPRPVLPSVLPTGNNSNNNTSTGTTNTNSSTFKVGDKIYAALPVTTAYKTSDLDSEEVFDTFTKDTLIGEFVSKGDGYLQLNYKSWSYLVTGFDTIYVSPYAVYTK